LDARHPFEGIRHFLQKPMLAWGGNVAKMKTDMKMTYLKKESSDELTSTGRSGVD